MYKNKSIVIILVFLCVPTLQASYASGPLSSDGEVECKRKKTFPVIELLRRLSKWTPLPPASVPIVYAYYVSEQEELESTKKYMENLGRRASDQSFDCWKSNREGLRGSGEYSFKNMACEVYSPGCFVDFSNADFSNFDRTSLAPLIVEAAAYFYQANFANAQLPDHTWENITSADHANFTGANLQRNEWQRILSCKGLKFVGADLSDSHFGNIERVTDMTKADFSGANLKNCRFMQVKITQEQLASAANTEGVIFETPKRFNPAAKSVTIESSRLTKKQKHSGLPQKRQKISSARFIQMEKHKQSL